MAASRHDWAFRRPAASTRALHARGARRTWPLQTASLEVVPETRVEHRLPGFESFFTVTGPRKPGPLLAPWAMRSQREISACGNKIRAAGRGVCWRALFSWPWESGARAVVADTFQVRYAELKRT